MENPHEERQIVILERINKNTVKTIELMNEANKCLAELYRANESIRTVAALTDKYRRNVYYNLSNVQTKREPRPVDGDLTREDVS